MRETEFDFRQYRVLGIPIQAVQLADVVQVMETWISAPHRAHFVSLVNVHVLMEAQRHVDFRKVIDCADLRLPDGTPVMWLGRLQGHYLPHRVEGPALMLEFCRRTQRKGYRHFFYGGAAGEPEEIADLLKRQFPDVEIAGTYSPPFRPLTPEENARVVEMINRAACDVLWVGLGAPKQERWICEHLDHVDVPAMIGVGQAFDILSGRKRQAPAWVRQYGLEWLYRFAQEPRRLWRRYLVYNPLFVWSLFAEFVGVKRFE